MNLKFLSFIKTPGDEKQIGIATISIDEKILFRYKITYGKDRKGFYVQEPAVKIGDGYEKSFVIDSNIVAEEIKRIIREKVSEELGEGMPF